MVYQNQIGGQAYETVAKSREEATIRIFNSESIKTVAGTTHQHWSNDYRVRLLSTSCL